MLCPRSRTHIKHQILQTRRLRCRPMNTGSRVPTRNGRHIKNKVAYLSIEDVGRAPVQACRIIFVAIYESESGETCGSLDHRDVGWVANQHGVVLVEDRGGNQIGTGWEIDYSGGGGAGCAAFAAAAAGEDGVVDSCCIIGDTIT